MRIVLSAVVAACVLSTTALAQGAPTESGPVKDPTKIVCKTRPNVGSRLGGTKSCRTRQEWADMRQQTRETVEKTQQLWQKN